jgi:hypothetical protein
MIQAEDVADHRVEDGSDCQSTEDRNAKGRTCQYRTLQEIAKTSRVALSAVLMPDGGQAGLSGRGQRRPLGIRLDCGVKDDLWHGL